MFDINRFKGVVVPIVNPCNEDDSIDWPVLEQNFTRLAAASTAGMYVNGGTGDAANLTQAERLQIAEWTVPKLRAAGKLAIVHVGQTNQRQAVALAEQAVALGADAVASIPPKTAWPQIADYYRALAATGAPVIVYYIPGVTGVTAGMPELRSLLDIHGVAGIKMSDWNIFLLRNIKLEYPDKVVYSGFDEMLVPGLLYGADGCIGTWANLLPELYAKVYAGVQSGAVDGLKAIMDEFTAFLSLGWNCGIISAFEELMLAKGYAWRCFRHPAAWEPGKIEPALAGELLQRLNLLEEMAAGL
jgi:dihydrodipicolinate synthase/N-acetylneuraminate lyase